MRHFLFAIILFFACINAPKSQINIDLIPYATGLEQPVDIANANDGRLFVAEKDGYIRIIEADGTVLSAPFLDISDQVRSAGQEQGLLGLVFHPDYANNGYFYVSYTVDAGTVFISRYSVSSSNPNIANPNSRLILYTVDQPAKNHNGGDLNFGPDGYLYIGLGDGGGNGDPGNRAQNLGLKHGKIMRIDVDNGILFSIPPDNPFAGETPGLDEIWAYGLRNPWRFSFDRLTGDMWIADLGQDSWEEVNYQPAASAGGENYGWRCLEGEEPFNDFQCSMNPADYTMPVHVYPNNSTSSGCSVTGGYVYRGANFPRLRGLYIYTDYCTGRFWSLQRAGQGEYENVEIAQFFSYNYSSFGEDKDGELFVAGYSDGVIYNVVDPLALPIELLSFTAQTTDNKSVDLRWITASEKNSAHFEIQRSVDGISFLNISRTVAAGNSNTEQVYYFKDEKPFFGTSYYRLKQVDIDGSVTYSDVVQVKLNRDYLTPNVYPNPVQNEHSLTIDFGNISSASVEIHISDMSGKRVYSRTFEAGQNRFEIPVNGLASGMYVINGRFDEYYFNRKLIVH